MFTFGRDHEKQCAIARVRRPDQAELISAIIDAVHDLLDGTASDDSIRPALAHAFIEGSTGVWEPTGGWLRQLVARNSQFESLWRELAEHEDGKVRFRVACFLNEMPMALAREIGARLREDRHKKTRAMALARLEEIGS